MTDTERPRVTYGPGAQPLMYDLANFTPGTCPNCGHLDHSYGYGDDESGPCMARAYWPIPYIDHHTGKVTTGPEAAALLMSLPAGPDGYGYLPCVCGNPTADTPPLALYRVRQALTETHTAVTTAADHALDRGGWWVDELLTPIREQLALVTRELDRLTRFIPDDPTTPTQEGPTQ